MSVLIHGRSTLRHLDKLVGYSLQFPGLEKRIPDPAERGEAKEGSSPGCA